MSGVLGLRNRTILLAGARRTADRLKEMSAAIRTRGLRKSYNGKLAVQGLDLEVRRGEFYGFLGPNGAGKTTTIHILTGVITATAGEVEVLGLPVPSGI